MKRRDFLKALPIGAAATTIPFWLGSARANALLKSPMLSAMMNASVPSNRALVIIFMEGGNDGLNTLVPFENPDYDKLRKNTGFVTAAEKASLTFKVRDDLAFNPSFNPLEPLWKEGKMAIVQNLGMSNPDLSHFRATDVWNSASDTDLLISTGWAARYLQQLYPNYPSTLPSDPIAISMGDLQSSIFQGKSNKLDIMIQDPRTFASSGKSTDANFPPTYGGGELKFVHDLIDVSNSYAGRFQSFFPQYAVNKVTYPDNPLAINLQRIAWCIAAGIQTPIYFTYLRGFDTHFSQFSKDPTVSGHGQLLKYVADAVFAFQRDLEALGVADRVLTMTYSEFGRRVFENGDWSSGTDHGTTAPHFLFGTNVNGELYGHHPNLINLDKDNNPFNEFEFRQLYASVLGDWFGADETLRTSILSPGRIHDPFGIDFPINGSSKIQSLIRSSQSKVVSQKENFELLPAMPNPFRDETTIRFRLPDRKNVVLEIFNAEGKQITTLIHTSLYAGSHEAKLSGKNLAAGSYYFRLQVGSDIRTGKVVRI